MDGIFAELDDQWGPSTRTSPAASERRRVSGGGWTSRRISFYASRVYFLLIILQIPLFRCGSV
ncbi:hypothetical protein TRIUR3_26101 [Triticum urartu]|uniref:Uncharacterized protein n=1 Tax=Triticum urartu TaxID=4572 RepID=M7ZNY5_TRIUA|nr:hypothetical protein TRIUR3_26101 [Triticum urartu]